jgi:hypothetical protein
VFSSFSEVSFSLGLLDFPFLLLGVFTCSEGCDYLITQIIARSNFFAELEDVATPVSMAIKWPYMAFTIS